MRKLICVKKEICSEVTSPAEMVIGMCRNGMGRPHGISFMRSQASGFNLLEGLHKQFEISECLSPVLDHFTRHGKRFE